MRAVAPGKFVLAGAYAVLEGAPAIVVSVDRYAVADTSTRGPGTTSELRAAFPRDDAPHVDLSGFSAAHGKLGLGGSAAALVAALVATEESAPRDTFLKARRLHREVQGGGSGVDIAASVFGGVQAFRLASTGIEGEPTVSALTLPPGVHIGLYAVSRSARTSELLERVAQLKATSRHVYDACMNGLCETSSVALRAAEQGTPRPFLDACRAFGAALAMLGDASGAPIFLPEVTELSSIAERAGDAFYPAGAGGGDLAVYVGKARPSVAFENAALSRGIFELNVLLGAKPAARIPG